MIIPLAIVRVVSASANWGAPADLTDEINKTIDRLEKSIKPDQTLAIKDIAFRHNSLHAHIIYEILNKPDLSGTTEPTD